MFQPAPAVARFSVSIFTKRSRDEYEMENLVVDYGGAALALCSRDRGDLGVDVFTLPAAGDYHMGAGSAALDAGVETGLGIDFDNHPRPLSGTMVKVRKTPN